MRDIDAKITVFQSTPPSRGATQGMLQGMSPMQFQSTPPSRGATSTHQAQVEPSSTFQSTPPSRGATSANPAPAYDNTISIHAPLAGGDAPFPPLPPRLPISIHAPLAGGDVGNISVQTIYSDISIHAPLAGGDGLPWPSATLGCYFNPRPPRGGRRDLTSLYRYKGSVFQSTPPSRGATETGDAAKKAEKISIHAPLAGGDGQ